MSATTYADLRGHTAATLYEAAVAVLPDGRFAVDPNLRAAWPGARIAANTLKRSRSPAADVPCRSNTLAGP